jgi:hypothetical protein
MRLPFHLRLNALPVRQWSSEWTTADKPVWVVDNRAVPVPKNLHPTSGMKIAGGRTGFCDLKSFSQKISPREMAKNEAWHEAKKSRGITAA